MPKTTANYGLKKPLYNENADIAVINESLDVIDTILTPTISAGEAPTNISTGKLAAVLGWLANRIKAITGKASWYDTPSVTLENCYSHIQNGTHSNATTSASGFMSTADKQKLDNATDSYTAERLMLRDSYGRAKVQIPSDTYDIANKTYVDTNFVRNNAAGTMSAQLTAQSNSNYTTRQVRNIVFWTSGSVPATSYGDIVLKIF